MATATYQLFNKFYKYLTKLYLLSKNFFEEDNYMTKMQKIDIFKIMKYYTEYSIKQKTFRKREFRFRTPRFFREREFRIKL